MLFVSVLCVVCFESVMCRNVGIATQTQTRLQGTRGPLFSVLVYRPHHESAATAIMQRYSNASFSWPSQML